MNQELERPDGLDDEVLAYLDTLRESGAVNMFGAGPYVQRQFGVDRRTAQEWVLYWMATFDRDCR